MGLTLNNVNVNRPAADKVFYQAIQNSLVSNTGQEPYRFI